MSANSLKLRRSNRRTTPSTLEKSLASFSQRRPSAGMGWESVDWVSSEESRLDGCLNDLRQRMRSNRPSETWQYEGGSASLTLISSPKQGAPENMLALGSQGLVSQLQLRYFLSSTSTTRIGFFPALKTSWVTLASRQPASPDLKLTVSSFFPFSTKPSDPSSRITPTCA